MASIDIEDTDQELVAADPHGYRHKYYRMMFYLMALLLSALILLIIFLCQLWMTPRSKYFATTITGNNLPLKSLDMPIVTNTYVLQWAGLAIRSTYNLDFNEYKQQLKQSSFYFTPSGFNSMIAAFNQAKVIDAVKDKKLIMSAIVDGAGTILSEGSVHGRYTWQVQIPFLVTYVSASEQKPDRFIATLNIVQVPVIQPAKDSDQVPSSLQINNVVISRYYPVKS